MALSLAALDEKLEPIVVEKIPAHNGASFTAIGGGYYQNSGVVRGEYFEDARISVEKDVIRQMRADVMEQLFPDQVELIGMYRHGQMSLYSLPFMENMA